MIRLTSLSLDGFHKDFLVTTIFTLYNSRRVPTGAAASSTAADGGNESLLPGLVLGRLRFRQVCRLVNLTRTKFF
jgi:hypothetical protein